jgi:hypothetical protein
MHRRADSTGKSVGQQEVNAALGVSPTDPASAVKMWSVIRAQYENSDISVRSLANQHGMRSHTQIMRRIKAEGWRRNVSTIMNALVEGGVADAARDQTAIEGELAEDGGGQAKRPKQSTIGRVRLVEGEKVVFPRQDGREPKPSRDKLAEARAMAELHKKQILEEQMVSEMAMRVSASILAKLNVILNTEDIADVRLAAQRLVLLASEGESLPNLMKSAIQTFKEAVTMRRRAIGMDPPVLPRGSSLAIAPPNAGDMPDDVMEMLPMLDLDSLEKLRDVAEKWERIKDVANRG